MSDSYRSDLLLDENDYMMCDASSSLSRVTVLAAPHATQIQLNGSDSDLSFSGWSNLFGRITTW